jgi:adenosylcobinamide-GDP ribazoletransferase
MGVVEEAKTLGSALMFLTRLPVPDRDGRAVERQPRAVAYFPIVGLVVGGIGACAYRLVSCGYSSTVAALAAVAATVIVTGGLHEDGFADVCDGFGGWTPERRLEIMRDSRVGSFGVLGLLILVGAKVALLASLSPAAATAALVVSHTAARWAAALMLLRFRPIPNATSAKPFTGPETPGRFAAATLLALPVALLVGPATALALVAAALLVVESSGRLFRRSLGGINGDCLGAAIQLTELACYALIVKSASLEALVRHIAPH